MPRIDHKKSGDPVWIEKQRRRLCGNGGCDCRCGGFMTTGDNAFRCLYCKEWFCTECAEEHFGMTVEQNSPRK